MFYGIYTTEGLYAIALNATAARDITDNLFQTTNAVFRTEFDDANAHISINECMVNGKSFAESLLVVTGMI